MYKLHRLRRSDNEGKEPHAELGNLLRAQMYHMISPEYGGDACEDPNTAIITVLLHGLLLQHECWSAGWFRRNRYYSPEAGS